MRVLPGLQVVEKLGPPVQSEADRARLERLFVSHHQTVWRTLRRRGLSPDAAADATQETFMVASARLADIAPDSERAFLIGTALRVARALGRKAARWHLDDMDQHGATPTEAQRHVDLQLCDQALSKVKEDLAEVFVLHEIEGLSSPEIAALLEIPLGSVASRLRRGREQFRAALTRIQLGIEREGKT